MAPPRLTHSRQFPARPLHSRAFVSVEMSTRKETTSREGNRVEGDLWAREGLGTRCLGRISSLAKIPEGRDAPEKQSKRQCKVTPPVRTRIVEKRRIIRQRIGDRGRLLIASSEENIVSTIRQQFLLRQSMDWDRNFVQLYAKLQRLTRRGYRVYRCRVIRGIVDVVWFRRSRSLELLCNTRLWNTVGSRRKSSHIAQILSFDTLALLCENNEKFHIPANPKILCTNSCHRC